MADAPFHDPHITLSKIYTRSGDEGDTSLVGGQRRPKDDLRIDAYGDVDELNATLGLAMVSLEDLHHPALTELRVRLLRVQHELFNLGSLLATLPEDLHPRQPVVTAEDVKRLEQEIDEANDVLGPLTSFVLPGGSRLNAELHLARTVCRRAERALVTLARDERVSPVALEYLNRLSDALFVWSRLANRALNRPESLWNPNFSQ